MVIRELFLMDIIDHTIIGNLWNQNESDNKIVNRKKNRPLSDQKINNIG